MTRTTKYRLYPLLIWLLTGFPICLAIYGMSEKNVGFSYIYSYVKEFGFNEVSIIFVAFWLAATFPLTYLIYEFSRVHHLDKN